MGNGLRGQRVGGADGGAVVQVGRLEQGAPRRTYGLGRMGESERGSEWRQMDRLNEELVGRPSLVSTLYLFIDIFP